MASRLRLFIEIDSDTMCDTITDILYQLIYGEIKEGVGKIGQAANLP